MGKMDYKTFEKQIWILSRLAHSLRGIHWYIHVPKQKQPYACAFFQKYRKNIKNTPPHIRVKWITKLFKNKDGFFPLANQTPLFRLPASKLSFYPSSRKVNNANGSRYIQDWQKMSPWITKSSLSLFL